MESEDVSEWSKAIKKVRDMARTVQLKEADLLWKHCSEKYSWEKQCGDGVEEMLKMASGMNFFLCDLHVLVIHIVVVKVKQCTYSLQYKCLS